MTDTPNTTLLETNVTLPAPGSLRWSVVPPSDAPGRTGTPAPDGLDVLLRWTEELDNERAITLWAGMSTVENPSSREAALLRWADWAGVTVPLGVKLRDLVSAVALLIRELELLVQSPERVYTLAANDLIPMVRALQGWMRARESQPGVVLGALNALLLARDAARAFPELVHRAPTVPAPLGADYDIEPDAPGCERISSAEIARTVSSLPPAGPLGVSDAVILASVQRRVLRGPIDEAMELLITWLRVDRGRELAPWALQTIDFALLVGEQRGVHLRPVAELALRAPSHWCALLRRGTSLRDALRAVRMLQALASHVDITPALGLTVNDQSVEVLLGLLAHGRIAVWSRAARAAGPLAGHLTGLSRKLLTLVTGSGPSGPRLRATAALPTLGAAAGPELLAQRDALLAMLQSGPTAHESAALGAIAVSLPDVCREGVAPWSDMALAIATSGGAEAVLALLRALHEIVVRDATTRNAVVTIAEQARARTEVWRGNATELERAERATVIAARLSAGDEATTMTLITELTSVVARNPAGPEVHAQITAFAAAIGVLQATASRALGVGNPRGGVTLEELVDLVIEGDLAVIAARVVEDEARDAVETAETLRTELLKMAWSGLRKATPGGLAWRRWLIRAAGVLPRAPGVGVRSADEERDQALESLERLADDPHNTHVALLRNTATSLQEIAAALTPTLGGDALRAMLVWLALRGSLNSANARMLRWFGDDPAAAGSDRILEAIEGVDHVNRDVALDVATLGAIAGGEACRLGEVLSALGAECAGIAQRQPELHWSGLPRFDLMELSTLVESLQRVRDDAVFALTRIERQRPSLTHARVESLTDHCARVNRILTTTSLKFMDAARRAEVVEHYLTELGALAERIAEACGPLLGPGIRSLLAKTLVAVRTIGSAQTRDGEQNVRYIGRLRVLGELSSSHEGGMTSTFLAEGGAPGKKVVVKLLRWGRFRGTTAELARAMFEGEMERLAGVVHPNIVSIMDAGFVDEGAYIAVEYIPGASLETLLRKIGRVELRTLGPIVRDVARALTWLHARKIIHRDIKPGNIIVQLDQLGSMGEARGWTSTEIVRAVLIDFGVATEITRAGSHEGVTGTPGYIAPEIARGLNLFGPAVDTYALGVVIFELLTGSNPFLEGSQELNAVLVRHGSTTLPWQRLPPEASKPDVVQLLAEATRIDPRLRPSMKDFLTRWSKALGLGQ